MSHDKPRGLPGFLRRSLRFTQDENDDDDNSDENPSENNRSNASVEDRARLNDDSNDNIHNSNGGVSPPTTSRNISQQQNNNNARTGTPTGTPMATPAPTPILNKQLRSAMPDIPTLSLEKSGATDVDTDTTVVTRKGSWVAATPNPTSNRKSDTIKRTKNYKDRQFDTTIQSDVVNMADLRRLGWNGIASEHRPTAWKLLLGYLPTNSARRSQTLLRKRNEYKDAIAQHYDIDDDTRTMQEQETLRQVLVDVPRTAPNVGLFRDDRIRKALSRLLYIWACRHPASSYVQGINDLATPLVVVFLQEYGTGTGTSRDTDDEDDYDDGYSSSSIMDGSIMSQVSDEDMEEIEADCYWCLTNLLAGIQDHYTSDQPGVQRMVMRLEELVTRIDADLTNYFKSVGIEFMQFAFKWMNCLLLREFNLKCVQRLWDTYIAEGDGGFEDFHVYVCAAFLCQFSSQLQHMEFEELFGFMQRLPTEEWGDTEIEILLSQAFVLSTLFGGSDAHLRGSREANRVNV
mmetsp:Transcript_7271/g.12057  ORF Transcript_7271/g.12057 Transcript_7271/m.12057 type:complete len:516 (+) Transcript_7271:167-1714(+)